MSGKGCCYDNSVMESFYHTLKTGLMCGKAFVSREEALNAIFDYIEVCYDVVVTIRRGVIKYRWIMKWWRN
ncbi:IS3 family transposase [Pectobacterium odoriferum]|uniref:IS3 family transposase n=1 Tax=Pectobacterium odoriferum TaxID=78398 RepID=UPI00358DB777